jgi:cysteine desulfurase
MAGRIYFDNAATSPLDPRVAEAMRPWLGQRWGNPSSLYTEGREARQAVDAARRQVASLLGAEPGELVFTSGGTESDNLAIAGVMVAAGLQGSHLITSAIEHPAVLECAGWLERCGAEWTRLPVDGDGLVDPDALRRALRPNTRLVSVMAANNVVSTIQPIRELGAIARQHGALFHTDAVQAVGKLALDVRKLPIDLLSLSGHKLHGPQGIGALFVRDGIRLEPVVRGGGQERGLRSGTENVAGIVGLGRAAELAAADTAEEAARLVQLRDHLIDTVFETIPNAYLVGDRYRRLPGHVCLGFAGLEGEAIRLLLGLDQQGISLSSGSACSATHAGRPSHVLEAMGYDPLRARGSLRISLGRFNTRDEVDRFLQILPAAVAALRPMSGLETTLAHS